MKRFTKIFLIISGILAVLGIVLVIVGTAMGGANKVADDFINNRLNFIVDDAFFSDDNTQNMNSINENGNQFPKEEIKSIELQGKFGEYEIGVWSNANYAVQPIKGADKIKYSVENGVLKITTTSKKFIFRGNHNVKAKIYIPEDIVLDSVTLNMGAGTLNCNNIKTQQLDVNVGAGEGTFNNIEAVHSDFKVGAGDGEIKNAKFTDCILKVGVGDLDVEGNITGNIDLDCGVGNVDMNLSNLYTDFNYQVDVGAGDVELGEQEYSGVGHNINLNNNAEYTMKIKCGMGDVSVDFAN